MTEVIKNSGVDKGSDYDVELAKINNDLSELKESILREPDKEPENQDLPEGFEYDSEGCIICKSASFTKEDYDSQPTPIERVLGGKMKEGEYRGIDYSKCNRDSTKTVRLEYKQLFLFLRKSNGHIIMEGENDQPIMLLKGTKIIPPHDKYMKFIGYKGDISNNKDLVKNLNKHFISFSDIKSLFGEEKTESEIFEILKNINFDDNIDEQMKKQILGEYADAIEPVNYLLGLTLISLKNKIGDTFFYKHIGDFIKTNTDFYKINTYLHSGYCTITQENMDEYLDFIKAGRKRINLLGYTLNEVKLMKKYGCTDINGINNNYDPKRLENIENNGITPSMFKFAKLKLNEELSIDTVEELFIEEKEGINLFYFLSKFPQKLQNLGGKEIKEIDLNVEKRNFCFRGILEMIKSRGDIDTLPYPGENAEPKQLNERKESREKIIKEYENLLRNYISLDKDENGNEIPRDQTFNKIFYSIANSNEEDRNGAFLDPFDKQYLQLFSKNAISDYSNTRDKNGKLDQTNQKKMLEDLCDYASQPQHSNEKILVYIGAHGGKDGGSGNGRTKQDWLKISQYPNIKIMSCRCYFGTVYNSKNDGSGDYIYNQPSTISGFSNKTVGTTDIDTYLREGVDLGLGFHELELYARLKYEISSPLTERIEYQDRKTGETEKKNVGLAYGGGENVYENNA